MSAPRRGGFTVAVHTAPASVRNDHHVVTGHPAHRPAKEAPANRRVLRRALVEERTGFKRAHIYSLMKEKKFPQRVRLGVRAVGWYEDEIDQWLADRERA